MHISIRYLPLLSLVIFLGMVHLPQVEAANYVIPAGDSAALINALQTASDTPGTADVIDLAPGSTYILTAINNSYIYYASTIGSVTGDNGLPVIRGEITINGNDATVERSNTGQDFRLLFIHSNGNLTLNNLTLRQGRASKIGAARGTQGGGILNLGTVTINDSLITQNIAKAGAGILNYHASLSINRSTISDNIGEDTAGGIWTIGNLVLIDSTVTSNTLETGSGAGISIDSGSAMIRNSTISENSIAANGIGGGIYMVGGIDALIEISNNSTISGNSAAGGGGIYNASGRFSVRNVTIANNIATESGGGVYQVDTEGTEEDNDQFKFENAILSDNQPTNCNLNATFASSGNNIDSDGSCVLYGPSDLSGIDPRLDALADNGGPTETHALLAGSPAINRANRNLCPPFDQRGELREIACDIGSFEYIHPDLAPILHLYPTANPRLTWSQISWATGYEVEVADNNRFELPVFHDASLSADVESVIVTSHLDNKVWYWHVRAKKPNGEWGAWSPTEAIRIEVSVP